MRFQWISISESIRCGAKSFERLYRRTGHIDVH